MKKNIFIKLRKWFTLIEMLIVIVIIWILLWVLIRNYTWVQAKARNTAKIIAIKNISDSLVRYQWDENQYPDGSENDLKAKLWVYGKSIDPAKYNITYKKVGDRYILCAKLEKEWTNANANSNTCPTSFDANFVEASKESKSTSSELYYVIQE